MKNSKTLLYTAVILASAACALWGQDASSDRIAVPFSDPGKPGRIEASLINGGITVSGYEGKEVIIESRTRGQVVPREGKAENKHPGMKRLSASGGGLRVEERENVMEISTPSWKADIDLAIQVPVNTSLELHTVNNGNIKVENVNGDMEVANVNGGISLSRIGGAAVVQTVNGDVTVSFARLDGKKPLSLATLNGDVDLTLPADAKVSLKMKIDNQGEIYSDFDLAVQSKTEKTVSDKRHSDERERGGRYHLSIENSVVAALNGGGQEITLKTFNGDILLRKAK